MFSRMRTVIRVQEIDTRKIVALIAVAAIGAMQGNGTKLTTTFNNVSNHLPSS